MNEPWQHAMKYVGTPFRHRARSTTFLDCSGLLIKVAWDLGLKPKQPKVYGREPYEVLEKYLELNMGTPYTTEERELDINDVVLMRLHRDKRAGHLGIIAPHPRIEDALALIHTSGELRRVVCHILDDNYRSRIVAIYPWAHGEALCKS